MGFGICPGSGHNLNVILVKYIISVNNLRKKLEDFHSSNKEKINEDLINHHDNLFFLKYMIERPCCRHYIMTFFYN